METKKTALYDTHQSGGAKIVPFAGYELPVWYTNIKDEHLAVRHEAGLFDISHMGLLKFTGEKTLDFLQSISCNDLTACQNGKMIYSMTLNENGGILDDIMVGGLPDSYLMVVNASNKAKLIDWFNQHLLPGVTMEDINPAYSLLAVQGPKALEKMTQAFDISFDSHPKFTLFETTALSAPIICLRTGYTGEDGGELLVPNDHAETVWKALLAVGVTPCGLGARDSLRIEAGLPLYGQELSETINPYETRYKWVVKLNHDFIGRKALEAAKDKDPEWKTVGLEMIDKGIPRPHYEIAEGGEVTSGCPSPYLDKAIGMARVKPEFAAVGTELSVLVRNKPARARVVKMPFI